MPQVIWRFGNVQATDILYAGLSPDFVGVYQVNVKVPDGVQAGDAVPVTITVGNLQSQPGVTMAVAQWRPELIWCGWRGEDRRHEVRTTWLTPHAPAPVPLPRRSTGPPATPWPIVRDRRRADGRRDSATRTCARPGPSSAAGPTPFARGNALEAPGRGGFEVVSPARLLHAGGKCGSFL